MLFSGENHFFHPGYSLGSCSTLWHGALPVIPSLHVCHNPFSGTFSLFHWRDFMGVASDILKRTQSHSKLPDPLTVTMSFSFFHDVPWALGAMVFYRSIHWVRAPQFWWLWFPKYSLPVEKGNLFGEEWVTYLWIWGQIFRVQLGILLV